MPDQALVNSDLQSALAEVRQAYIAGNPKSFARHQEACEAMPGGNTRTTLHNAPFPLTVVRGEGCRLWDADGHEYIDVLGEYTAGIYGHSHPVIRAAIDRALNHGWNYGGRNANEAKLAKLVADRMPSIDLVRFTNSGTEANLMAIAAARRHTGRSKVLVFDGAYHGGALVFGILRYANPEAGPSARSRGGMIWGLLLVGFVVLGAGALGANQLVERFRTSSIALPIHIEAIRPQNRSGFCSMTLGPGVMPCTIIAPIISAMTGVAGMPRVSIGMNEVCAAALFADSGLATPSIIPVPNAAGVAEIFFSTE